MKFDCSPATRRKKTLSGDVDFIFVLFFGSTVAFAAESFEPLVINGCGITHMPPWQGVLKQELAWAVQAFIESRVSGRRE